VTTRPCHACTNRRRPLNRIRYNLNPRPPVARRRLQATEALDPNPEPQANPEALDPNPEPLGVRGLVFGVGGPLGFGAWGVTCET
jgi:hypothetical protein